MVVQGIIVEQFNRKAVGDLVTWMYCANDDMYISLGCDSSPLVGDTPLRENARISASFSWNQVELVFLHICCCRNASKL